MRDERHKIDDIIRKETIQTEGRSAGHTMDQRSRLSLASRKDALYARLKEIQGICQPHMMHNLGQNFERTLWGTF